MIGSESGGGGHALARGDGNELAIGRQVPDRAGRAVTPPHRWPGNREEVMVLGRSRWQAIAQTDFAGSIRWGPHLADVGAQRAIHMQAPARRADHVGVWIETATRVPGIAGLPI